MSSNVVEFPVEEFLQCLRNGNQKPTRFINQAESLNTEWIYETIKHCHNTILEMKQLPVTKLNALYLIRDLMQTCQVPCLDLVQVYILPMVYEIAIQKPQEKGDRRGSTFFQTNGKVAKIPNIQETGIKFMALCTEILSAGSIIKPKRTFQNHQLRQNSQFYDYFEKFKKYGISGIPNSPSQYKNFSPQFIQKGRQKYLSNLKQFHNGRNNYSEYFVTKIMQSVQSDTNPLLNNGQSVSSLSNDLDMRKLLKQGDTIITSPLIQELLLKMKTLDSFMGRKNCLALLTDFVKWGDAEALLRICYDGSLRNIGLRVAEVNGNKGMVEGENIYSEVKGQRDGKRKFYTQYLKSLQVISKCLEIEKLQMEQASRIQDLYAYFKKQKKFQFPQNLMLKRIETDFRQNLQNNQQRNVLVMKKLRESGSQLQKKGARQSKELGMSATLIQLNKNMEECLDQIFKVTANQKDVNARMTKIMDLKNKCEEQIEKIDEFNSDLKDDDVVEMMENGLEIAQIVDKLEVLHKDYKNNTINFNEFQQKHAMLTKDFEIQSSQPQSHLKIAKSGSGGSHLQLKNSLEEVVNSYNVKKDKVNHPNTLPSFRNQMDLRASQELKTKKNQSQISAHFEGQNQNYNHTELTNGFNKLKLSDEGPQPAFILTAPTPNPPKNWTTGNQLVVPGQTLPLTLPQKRQGNEDEILNQVTSSIISDKEKKQQKNLKEESKISERRESGASMLSESFSLKQKVEQRRQQRESKVKELSQIQNQMLSQPLSGAVHSIMQRAGSNFSNDPSSNEKKSSHIESSVEYVNYIAPESVKVTKPNKASPNTQADPVIETPRNNFVTTAPNYVNQLKFQTDPKAFSQNKSKSEIKQQSHNEYGLVSYQNGPSQGPSQVNRSSQNASQLSGGKISEPKRSQIKTVVGPNGFNGPPPVRQPQYHTTAYKKSQQNIFNMYMAQKAAYNPYRTVQQAQNNSSDSNKENPPQENFAKTLQADSPKEMNRQRLEESQESSSYHTCKGELSRQQNESHNESNFVLNSKEFKALPNQNGNGNRKSLHEEFHTAKSHGLSDSGSVARQPVSYNYGFRDDEDYIREPEFKPLEESYYDPREIEARVKQSLKPEFKDCFRVEQELIPSTFRGYDISAVAEPSQFSRLPVSNVSRAFVNKPHQEYMMAKLKRQYERERDPETRDLSNRVIGLKVDNSRLRNELRLKEESRNGNSRSDSSDSSSVVEFSRSKSKYSNSPLTLRPQKSNVSAVSQFPLVGSPLNESTYYRFLPELNDDKTKKACLKNKSILFKNDLWQIGCMFKYTPVSTILTLYLTPSFKVSNFNCSISREPNLQIESLSKGFSQIAENKQVKMEFECKLKNIPYTLPMMNINFNRGNEQRNLSFYLPLSFNKFVNFQPADPTQIITDMKRKQRQLKSTQFQLNTKTAKTSNILEYFPNMAQMPQQLGSRQSKYTSIASFKRESIPILLSTKGKDKVMLQTTPRNEKESQVAQYLVFTIRKLMSL